MRTTRLERKTRETEVECKLDLDGSGKASVEVPDQFLRHMVESLAKYSSFDIDLKAKGDNEHHLIEDVAIVLGSSLKEAIATRPIERISSATVPM
ncbi:MAG TPA: imidazoleglycerol-phosphate dehydratase, partial [Methanomassiliicoccales archaeon]|nr:imidazoleglycerol-phosphate dehydratase [Methanomassiliicoccales archaeon]